MTKIIDIKYEIDKRTKEWKNLIYDGYIFDSPIALIRYCIEQGEKQAKDIKADHLAGHYIAGKEQGIKDTLQVLRNQGYDIVYTSEEIEDKLKQIQEGKKQ